MKKVKNYALREWIRATLLEGSEPSTVEMPGAVVSKLAPSALTIETDAFIENEQNIINNALAIYRQTGGIDYVESNDDYALMCRGIAKCLNADAENATDMPYPYQTALYIICFANSSDSVADLIIPSATGFLNAVFPVVSLAYEVGTGLYDIAAGKESVKESTRSSRRKLQETNGFRKTVAEGIGALWKISRYAENLALKKLERSTATRLSASGLKNMVSMNPADKAAAEIALEEIDKVAVDTRVIFALNSPIAAAFSGFDTLTSAKGQTDDIIKTLVEYKIKNPDKDIGAILANPVELRAVLSQSKNPINEAEVVAKKIAFDYKGAQPALIVAPKGASDAEKAVINAKNEANEATHNLGKDTAKIADASRKAIKDAVDRAESYARTTFYRFVTGITVGAGALIAIFRNFSSSDDQVLTIDQVSSLCALASIKQGAKMGLTSIDKSIGTISSNKRFPIATQLTDTMPGQENSLMGFLKDMIESDVDITSTEMQELAKHFNAVADQYNVDIP